MRFWKLIKKMMNKRFKVVAGKRGDGMKEFFMNYINSLTVYELESLHLQSGARFTIEDGKITNVEMEKAAEPII